jgi:hypothetical protein
MRVFNKITGELTITDLKDLKEVCNRTNLPPQERKFKISFDSRDEFLSFLEFQKEIIEKQMASLEFEKLDFQPVMVDNPINVDNGDSSEWTVVRVKELFLEGIGNVEPERYEIS